MSTLLRVGEVAARLGVSAGTVYGLVAAGKLRCSRIGLGRGCIRVSEQQIDEYLAGGVSPPPPPVVAPYRPRHVRTTS